MEQFEHLSGQKKVLETILGIPDEMKKQSERFKELGTDVE